MTSSPTAVHGTNGTAAHLSPPEFKALVEKIRAILMAPANETPEDLVRRVRGKDTDRSMVERLVDNLPLLEDIDYKAKDFSGSKGTEALKVLIALRFTGEILVDPRTDAEDSADEGTEEPAASVAKPGINGSGKSADNAAKTAPALDQDQRALINILQDAADRGNAEAKTIIDSLANAVASDDAAHQDRVDGLDDALNLPLQVSGANTAALLHYIRGQGDLWKEVLDRFRPQASFRAGQDAFAAKLQSRRADALDERRKITDQRQEQRLRLAIHPHENGKEADAGEDK